MTFNLVAANAPSLGPWFGPALTPRLDMTSQPVINARNTSDGGDTINMFIDSSDPDFEYAASIVDACSDQTVIAIQCTSGSDLVGANTCGPNAVMNTVTFGSTTYEFSSDATTNTMGVEVTATAIENCNLAGTTAATCTATIKGTADGTKTTTSGVITMTGATYYRFDVEITGGAEKTASPTSCKGAASGLNAKNMAIWALAGVMGVAGVLAL